MTEAKRQLRYYWYLLTDCSIKPRIWQIIAGGVLFTVLLIVYILAEDMLELTLYIVVVVGAFLTLSGFWQLANYLLFKFHERRQRPKPLNN